MQPLPLICHHCYKIFMSPLGLRNHLRVHVKDIKLNKKDTKTKTTVDASGCGTSSMEIEDIEIISSNSDDSSEASAIDATSSPKMEISSENTVTLPTVEASVSGSGISSSEIEVIELASSNSDDSIEAPAIDATSSPKREVASANTVTEPTVEASVSGSGTSSSEIEVIEINSSSSDEASRASAVDGNPSPEMEVVSPNTVTVETSESDTPPSEMEVEDIIPRSDEATDESSEAHGPDYCDLCNRNLTSQSDLEEHFRYSHHMDRLECIFCGEVFFQGVLLSNHERNYHPNEIFYRCEDCHKRFITEAGIVNHNCVAQR